MDKEQIKEAVTVVTKRHSARLNLSPEYIDLLAIEISEVMMANAELQLNYPDVPRDDWICRECGKSTYWVDYEHLWDKDLHMGCVIQDFMKNNPKLNSKNA